MHETYDDWVNNIQTDTHNHDHIYYQNMVNFAKDIMLDIAYTKQHLVARKLHLQASQFSQFIKILKAL